MSCSKCKKQQYSSFDNKYLKLFGICWTCDTKRWDDGELSLEEFELKEKKAMQDTVDEAEGEL